MKKKHSKDMYRLYEEYKESLKNIKKLLRKRQKLNADIREKYEEPFARRDHIQNTKDITNLNSMANDLIEDLKKIEMYLDFEDRYYLHKEYNDMKSMIYNQNSYEGEIPFEDVFGEWLPDTTEIICNVELQEEVLELMNKVLTERQRQVVHLYFWEKKTQKKIANKLKIKQNTISQILTISLAKLRNYIKYDEIYKN